MNWDLEFRLWQKTCVVFFHTSNKIPATQMYESLISNYSGGSCVASNDMIDKDKFVYNNLFPDFTVKLIIKEVG